MGIKVLAERRQDDAKAQAALEEGAYNAYNFPIDESQRQIVLLALAHLAVERPGWNYALTEIAKKLDTPESWKRRQKEALRGGSEIHVARGEPVMFTRFKAYHLDALRHAKVEECAAVAAAKYTGCEAAETQRIFADGYKTGWAALLDKIGSSAAEAPEPK